jgi:hypothetical protein
VEDKRNMLISRALSKKLTPNVALALCLWAFQGSDVRCWLFFESKVLQQSDICKEKRAVISVPRRLRLSIGVLTSRYDLAVSKLLHIHAAIDLDDLAADVARHI